MISIVTSCIKRELYLYRLMESILSLGGWDKVAFEHFIVFQGAPPSDKMRQYLDSLPFASSLKIGTTEKVEPIGAILFSTAKKAQYPIFFKIDDDCALMSRDFFPRIVELCIKMPRAILYPALVDGEMPLTDIEPALKQTVFLEKNNVFVTVGKETGSSGMYIIPLDMARDIPFEGQKDAENVAVAALTNHLPIFQALNGLVIEIQDGHSGQAHRKHHPIGQSW